MDLGDRFLSSTFYTKFTTVNASGVPTTLGSTPSLQFYVNAGVTAFTAGLSLDVDLNSITGMNHVTVIATTSATAWATGTDVQVIVATGTVSGVSIKGYKVCEFSIQNRAALRPVTAGRNLVVDTNGLADANMVKMGPTGAGTAQTARDIGLSVLLSSGTATGQILLSAGQVTVATNNDKTGYSLTAGYDPAKTAAQAGDAMALTAGERTTLNGVIKTTAVTEAYRANGAAPTEAQFMCEVLAHLGEASIAGTTKTVKKLDHATTAETFTLDSATVPTSITRAS